MKKSKFLKKSLATLLALMLVVAMIPVGAAAADDPTVYVDNQLATLSGTVYTVTAKSTEVTVTTVPQDGVTLVAVDKDQNEIALADSIKLTEKAKKNGDVYTLGLRAKVTQDGDDATTDKDYTLNITVETAAQSSDATIKSVSIDGMASYDISDTKITVYMPFGETLPTDLGTTTEEKFIPASDKATPVYSGTVLTVTAEDGSTKKYDVELKNETGFATFTVPNQVGDTTISEKEKVNTVAIQMPFGTDWTQKNIPTFTVGETVTKVTTEVNGEEIEVKSGVTALSFTKDTAVDFKVFTKTNKTTGVTVKVTLTEESANTEAALKSIQVGKSNTVEVTGTTVTVEMPKGYKFDGKETVTFEASKNATVTVPAQGIGVTSGVLENVSVVGKTFVIRVVSEDEKTTTDYTINLTAAAADEAQLKDFTLKGKLNDENVSYSADWTGTKGVITLPYALTDTTVLGDFLVYATVSTGASLSEMIENGTKKYSDLTSKPAFGTAAEYKVTAQDGTVVTYTVVLKAETAKTGKTVSSATLVGTKKVSSITADNTYKVTVGTAKDTADNTVKSLKVDVPYTFADDGETYFSNLTLSDGAVAYLYDSTADKIVKLDMDAAGDQGATTIKVPTDAFSSTTNKLTTASALSIYVVSEKNAVGADFENEAALQAVATRYYLYGVNAKPESGAAITGIKSDVDKNVTASLSAKDKTITVTVPDSYAKSEAKQTFTLNFSKSKMAEVCVGTENKDTKLNSDLGSAETTDATKFTAKGGQLAVVTGSVAITSGADKEGKITVYAEDEKTSNPYTVKLVVADPEAGASITALKVGKYNATISGKTINVTLPYGTKLNPLKLDITASKMATVTVGTDEYDADANYDLNNNLTIKVTSEDTKTTNVYTLKATVSAQFTDVKEGTWYYDYVMQAAAAGIVNGKGNGIFDPEGNVTRRDFALMTARMLKADTSSYTTSPFKDVNDNDYALGAIAYCYDKKIIGGYEDGTFRPDANISREEAAKIVCVALGLSEVKNPTETFKDDAKIQNWAKGYVYACKEAGIFGGDNGNFLPGNPITRAETAKVMVISMNK